MKQDMEFDALHGQNGRTLTFFSIGWLLNFDRQHVDVVEVPRTQRG